MPVIVIGDLAMRLLSKRDQRRMGLSVLLAATFISAPALASGAQLDPSFSGDGRAIVSDAPPPHAIAVGPDGSVVISGFESRLLSGGTWVSRRLSVTRLTPSGHLDQTFGNHGTARLPIDRSYKKRDISDVALRVTPDGSIVSIARVQSAAPSGGATLLSLSRLTSTGAVDRKFGMGDGLLGVQGEFMASSIDSAGRILLANDGELTRLAADGQIDPAFSDDGVVGLPSGFGETDVALATTPDDGVIAVHARTGSFARYDESGNPVAGFGNDGTSEIPSAAGDEIQLIVGPAGDTYFFRAQTFSPLWRDLGHLNADGSLDTQFGGDGLVPFRPYEYGDAVADSSGRVVFTAHSRSGRMAVERLDASGHRDAGFGFNGIFLIPFPKLRTGAAVLASDLTHDTLIAAGAAAKRKGHHESYSRWAVARFRP